MTAESVGFAVVPKLCNPCTYSALRSTSNSDCRQSKASYPNGVRPMASLLSAKINRESAEVVGTCSPFHCHETMSVRRFELKSARASLRKDSTSIRDVSSATSRKMSWHET